MDNALNVVYNVVHVFKILITAFLVIVQISSELINHLNANVEVIEKIKTVTVLKDFMMILHKLIVNVFL